MVIVPKRSDALLRNDFSNYTNWEDMDSDPRKNTSIKIINRTNYETYKSVLQEVLNKHSTIDGDNIVDEYTGYIITEQEFNIDEGYDEIDNKFTVHYQLFESFCSVFFDIVPKRRLADVNVYLPLPKNCPPPCLS